MRIKNILKSISRFTVYQTVPPYNLNWMRRQSFLEKYLDENPIGVVDIGARNGSCEELEPLVKYINYIGFDADEKECARLNKVGNPHYKSFEVLPIFVGTQKQVLEFHLYNSLGNSSSLEPNPEFQKYFNKDFRISRTVKVDSDTLDNVLKDKRIDIDFIKLDTQGTEYDILNASNAVLQNALMVECEVEFVEMYKNQKLFHDVCFLLYEKGFALLYLNRVFGNAQKFLGRSRGQIIFGDALFGLRRDVVKRLPWQKKLKYCSLLVNYGHIDFAYDIFNESKELQKEAPELGTFFGSLTQHPTNLLGKIIVGLLSQFEKIIFLLLVARKTNHLRNDSDRSWPIR